jgi:sec-independent protein translocase protein TatA
VLSTIFSGSDDLIVILVAFVVLFGGSQLPKLAKNTGEALREFRKAHSEAEAGTKPADSALVAGAVAPGLPAAAPGVTAAAPVVPVAVAVPVSAVRPQAAAPAPGDYVTVTRAELDAMLAERAALARTEKTADH